MTSQIPAVTWETGITHESLRIIYYLKRLPEHELQNRGFLVLPQCPVKDNRRTVVFPDLQYSHIKDVWKLTSRLNPTTPMSAPSKLIENINSLLTPIYTPPHKELRRLQKMWSSKESKIFSTLFSLLPQYRRRISSINFVLTYTGTISQYNLVTPNHPNLTIYLRPDATLADILQVIILSLIRPDVELENRTWEEVESISDFLLLHTPLSKFLNSKKPIISLLRQTQSGRLVLQSQRYQSSLGIPTANNWKIHGDKIFYQHIRVDHLTSRQSLLLTHFINNYGQVVSLDTIASILWPDNDNFSLWAIVKEVARIRKHLKSLSLPGSLIQSHRKLGYSLR